MHGTVQRVTPRRRSFDGSFFASWDRSNIGQMAVDQRRNDGDVDEGKERGFPERRVGTAANAHAQCGRLMGRLAGDITCDDDAHLVLEVDSDIGGRAIRVRHTVRRHGLLLRTEQAGRGADGPGRREPVLASRFQRKALIEAASARFDQPSDRVAAVPVEHVADVHRAKITEVDLIARCVAERRIDRVRSVAEADDTW